MKANDVLELIELGEDSKTQFKENITSPDQLAQEMVDFSNALGGRILIGVKDNGDISGLTREDIRRLNQMVSNVASVNVQPPIIPTTEVVGVSDKKIMVVDIKKGISKPYCTNKGVYIIKSGADKRKISQEELQRLFQESNKIYADEMKVFGTGIEDIDLKTFKTIYEKIYEETIDESNITIEHLLNNLDLMSGENLTLAGLLLFGDNPQSKRPVFMIKAVSFFGNESSGTEYRDSEDIRGTLSELYKGGISFLLRNLKKVQVEESFNSEGRLEVPKLVLEELLVNALVHRNYFINAPIRVFIFDDRIEFISPGKLPNSLTTENIKYGISVSRNPVLTSFASKLLPYRGVGTGIVRSYKTYPHIEFINSEELDQFTVVVYRTNNNTRRKN